MVTRRVGALLTLVAAVVIVATFTAPWSADERALLGSEPRVDVLALSRDLVGGKAHFVGCKPYPHGRICQVEGPTGKRATCFLFGEGEYSCFESLPGDRRR